MYWAWPAAMRSRSLLRQVLSRATAPSPRTSSLPRWLTSKIPTPSRTAACSLSTPVALVLQRHLPAAELGELGTQRDVAVVQGRAQQGHARQGSASPRPRGSPPVGSSLVTTYTLRKGSPAKTRTDLVVIGVTRTKKGDLVAAPGAEDVAEAYGRRFKPLLSSMGFKADTGEVLRLPAGDAINAGQLLAVGLGPSDTLTLDKVRRAAGVAARNLRNAASVALALPAQDAAHVGCGGRGLPLRPVQLPGLQVRSRRLAGRRRRRCSATRRAARTRSRRSRTPGPWPTLVKITRDWVNTPPNDLPPETFADVRPRAGREAPAAARPHRRPERRGARSDRARGARLRRHPRRRPRARPARPGW